MTRRSSARLAGAMYLLYIAFALPAMVLSTKAQAGGESPAAKLASIAAHATAMRLALVFNVSTAFIAIALAVGLYGITRDEDHELALLGLCCRVGEGIVNAVSTVGMVALFRMATATATDTSDSSGAQAVAAYLMRQSWATISALLFAWGSTIFSWLLLRGRMIPIGLAWLGVLASVILVVCLPLQMASLIHSPLTDLMWIPMAAFEIPLGFWLIIKGVAPMPARAPEAIR